MRSLKHEERKQREIVDATQREKELQEKETRLLRKEQELRKNEEALSVVTFCFQLRTRCEKV
jgi:hypothetical protein